MPSYRLVVEAATLAELTAALTDAAMVLHAGGAGVDELDAKRDDELRALIPNGAEQPPLPIPPADYAPAAEPTPIRPTPDDVLAAARYQALTAQQASAAYQARATAGPYPPTMAAADTPPPVCRLGHGPMVFKGGGLSKSGKGLPIWSCVNTQCREAIWPDR